MYTARILSFPYLLCWYSVYTSLVSSYFVAFKRGTLGHKVHFNLLIWKNFSLAQQKVHKYLPCIFSLASIFDNRYVTEYSATRFITGKHCYLMEGHFAEETWREELWPDPLVAAWEWAARQRGTRLLPALHPHHPHTAPGGCRGGVCQLEDSTEKHYNFQQHRFS